MRRAQALKTKSRRWKTKINRSQPELIDEVVDSEPDDSDCSGCPACVMTTVLDKIDAENAASWGAEHEAGLEFGIVEFKEFIQKNPNNYNFRLLLNRAESTLAKMSQMRIALEEYEAARRFVKNASKKARRKEAKLRSDSISNLIKNVAEAACRNVVKSATNKETLPELQNLEISTPEKTRVPPSFECPVCFENSDDRLALNCGHVYCTACAPGIGMCCYVCSSEISLHVKLFGC
jgi:hypothetical protein